uniref:Uncharacterized protein n=1 Tax=Glossina palpalis gambiensis TaxID=67801 RepID=A0A1B0AZF7_9MUSC
MTKALTVLFMARTCHSDIRISLDLINANATSGTFASFHPFVPFSRKALKFGYSDIKFLLKSLESKFYLPDSFQILAIFGPVRTAKKKKSGKFSPSQHI